MVGPRRAPSSGASGSCADRLDSVFAPVLVDERHHQRGRPHLRSVSGVHPIFAAIEQIVDHFDSKVRVLRKTGAVHFNDSGHQDRSSTVN